MGRHIISIQKENATLEEIRIAKACAPTQEGFIRFQAIELLYDDYAVDEVAKISGRTIRSVQRLKKDFNARGIDGVAIKGKAGRPRKIPIEKFTAQYVPIVLNPDKVNEVHWTAIKFHGYLSSECKEELSYVTLTRYFQEQNLVQRVPRQMPDRQNQEHRKEFIQQFKMLAGQENNALWFCDESGFEGDPRPRRVWTKKGSTPVSSYLGDHIRHHIVGAVNPDLGQSCLLVVPHSDTEVFQTFLNEFAKTTAVEAKTKNIYLILDNASWHKAKNLKWHHIKPLYLPAYSPDLNPIEQIWKLLKGKFFTQWFAKTPEELIERICIAIQSLLPSDISSAASCNYLKK